jgi:hypothetical protein
MRPSTVSCPHARRTQNAQDSSGNTRHAGVLSSSQWQTHMPLNAWSKIKITFGTDATVGCYINDVLRGSAAALANYGRTGNWTFTIGSFDGDVDEG